MRMRVVMLHCHPVQATWHLHRITRRQLNLCCFVFSPTSTPWIQRNKHSQPIVLFGPIHSKIIWRELVQLFWPNILFDFFATHYWSRTWVGLFWSQPKRNTCWVSLSFCSFGHIIKCTSTENQMQIYFHFQMSSISLDHLEYAVKHKAMCCARQSPSDSRRCHGRTAALSWTMMIIIMMTMKMMMMVMTRRTRMMRRVTPWSFAERVPP